MARTPRSASGAAVNTGIRLDPDHLAKLDRLGNARGLSRSETVVRLLDRVPEADGDVVPMPPRQIPGQESLLGVMDSAETQASADRHPSAACAHWHRVRRDGYTMCMECGARVD